LTAVLPPNRAWATLASDQQIARAAAALEANGMPAIVVDTGDESRRQRPRGDRAGRGSSWALRRWAGHRPAGSRAARGCGHGVAAAQGRRNQRPATSPAAGRDRLPATPATVEAFMAGGTCRGVPHHQVLPGGGRTRRPRQSAASGGSARERGREAPDRRKARSMEQETAQNDTLKLLSGAIPRPNKEVGLLCPTRL